MRFLFTLASLTILCCTLASRVVGASTAADVTGRKESPQYPGEYPPELVHSEAPEYPAGLKGPRIRGIVKLEFFVERDGSVQEVSVLEQTNKAFGRAAVECLKKWKFKPGIKQGVTVRARFEIPIVFEDKP